MLSVGATTTGGFNALASNWEICEGKAAEHGQTVDLAHDRAVSVHQDRAIGDHLPQPLP